jgi:hypothetical protein
MSTIALFRISAPALDQDILRRVAESFHLGRNVTESDDAVAFHDDGRVLVRAGACAKFAGVLMYINHHAALGGIHEKPVDPERAGAWLSEFIGKHGLGPGKVGDDRARLELQPWSRFTEAFVFDGKERKRVRARTDAGVRFRLNGLPLSGPRTRIRAVFGGDELPLMVHVAVWDRLEHHGDAELVRAHDVVATLEKSIRGRTDCNLVVHAKALRLAYAASEEFQGRPDLLVPYYFVEIESPYHVTKGRADGGQAPRQLLKIPAWRSALRSDPASARLAWS